jgi:DNA-binding MurR/RpiR family transcriptional regulator
LSIQELSKRIGVSSASITRFAKAVGFSGYPALQKEIRKDVMENFLPMKNIKISIGEGGADGSILRRTIEQNAEALGVLYNEKLAENFSAATEIILNSRNVFVVGLRSSYCVAYYLSFMLSQFMDNVRLLDSDGSRIFDRAFFSSKDDSLVAISFERYTRLTAQVAKHFFGQGVPVITVTDAMSSPLAPYAKSCLIVPNNGTYSFTSAITVLNALVVAVGARNKDSTLQTMNSREKLVLDNGIYI